MLQVLGRAVRRGGVFLVGSALLIAGAAMLILPGPGIAVMFLGLVVLSAEFQWAQRALSWARDRYRSFKDHAQSRMPGGNRPPSGDPPTRNRPDQAA
ncbi:MAG TPA: PGPGW domain-containing protein [Actinomycetota bacterium]|nr:PGPGW domain-containing protein [Actinomycetota bacterium]